MARQKNDPLKNALPFERPVRELDLRIERLTKEAKQKEKEAKKEAKKKGGKGKTKAKAGGGQPKDPADDAEIRSLIQQRDAMLLEVQSHLTTWQRIQISRHPERPVTSDYMDLLFSEVMELHGDRLYGDDQAILTAFAVLDTRHVMLVAHRKGRGTTDRIACNWGSAHPEGYRKAIRCMQLADRMGLPIVSLINTPGAYPGIGAEERGQASAIAWNIVEMFRLEVPMVSVVIGEGGSGGALGIGVCDRLLVLENSYYSVISPEGCASILWKDSSKAEQAAETLKLDSQTLVDLGVADERIPEPTGGAHRDKHATTTLVGEALARHLDELSAQPKDERLAARERKYRALGRYAGVPPALPVAELPPREPTKPPTPA